MNFADIERVELQRMAGQLATAAGYLEKMVAVRRSEDGSYPRGLDAMAVAVKAVQRRLGELGAALPEGTLEAFGREHPLYEDQLDGPYCGYGAKDGKRSCPVRDLALHWDAWELLGTHLRRPAAAARAKASA